MRGFLLTLLSIGCIAFLILGNMYWQEKTAVSSSKAEGKTVTEEQSDEVVTEKEEIPDTDPVANWPNKAKSDYQTAKEDGETYKIALVGSPALGKETNGWSEQLKTALNDTYGESIEVEIFQHDAISIEFINSTDSDAVLDYAPDMVLFEPFSLNDNTGGVNVGDNHDSIDIFLRNLKGANEDVVLILQPTHPIYGATYYPEQVDALKVFAEESGFTYLNHWKVWPEDESLTDLLDESQETPNEEGHKVWADFLKNYFIAD